MKLSRRALLMLIGGTAVSSIKVAAIPKPIREHSENLTGEDWTRLREIMMLPHHVPRLLRFEWSPHSVWVANKVEYAIRRGKPAEEIAAALDLAIERETEDAFLVEVQQWIMTPTELAICQIDTHFSYVSSSLLDL